MQKRAAAILLQIGGVAVIIAVVPYMLFELDRYFVPKELVLHIVGCSSRSCSSRAGARSASISRTRFSRCSSPGARRPPFRNQSLGRTARARSRLDVRSSGARRLRRSAHVSPDLHRGRRPGPALPELRWLMRTDSRPTTSLNRAPGGTLRQSKLRCAHRGDWTAGARLVDYYGARHFGAAGIARPPRRRRWCCRGRGRRGSQLSAVIVLAGPLVVSRKYWKASRRRPTRRVLGSPAR